MRYKIRNCSTLSFINIILNTHYFLSVYFCLFTSPVSFLPFSVSLWQAPYFTFGGYNLQYCYWSGIIHITLPFFSIQFFSRLISSHYHCYCGSFSGQTFFYHRDSFLVKTSSLNFCFYCLWVLCFYFIIFIYTCISQTNMIILCRYLYLSIWLILLSTILSRSSLYEKISQLFFSNGWAVFYFVYVS